MIDSRVPFRWRTTSLEVYGPGLCFSIGEGAVLPMIPHIAESLGVGLGVSALIIALITVGELIGTLPGGWVLVRVGERMAMILAAILSIVAAGVCYLAPGPIVLAVGIFALGFAAATFRIARHSFVTTYFPYVYRARALSLLGGTIRLGYIVGPLAIAALVAIGGDETLAFLVQIAASTTVIVLLLVMSDPADKIAVDRGGEAAPSSRRPSLVESVVRNRRVLGTIGLGSAILALLRESRRAMLPIWAVWIGLDPAATAFIIGMAAIIDFIPFYLGGSIMDRHGRFWVVVPSMVVLSFSYLTLALTVWLPDPAIWFAVCASLLALGNGISAGAILTLGSDHTDPAQPAPFLAVWRLLTGIGSAGGPMLVAGVTAVSSLGVAAVVVAAIGLGGGWLLARTMPPGQLTRAEVRT